MSIPVYATIHWNLIIVFKDRCVFVNLFVSKEGTFLSKIFVAICAIAYIHKLHRNKVAKIKVKDSLALNIKGLGGG